MAGTVDASIYGDFTPPPNPVSLLSTAAGLQNTLNQNRLFQQQYNTNIGLGQIYKEAIDPNTGQLDTNKVNALIANNPNVTLALPEAIQNSQEAQQRNLAINSAQIDLAQKHINALNNYMAPLLANKNPSSGDVAATIGNAIATGLVSPQEGAQFFSTLPRDQSGKIDESQIGNWLKTQQMMLMSAQERLNALSPPPTTIDQGNNIGLYRLPQVGQPSQVGVIQKGLPPTTQVFNPQTKQMQYLGGGAPNSNVNSGPLSGSIPGTGNGGLAAGPPLGAGPAADVWGHNSAQQGINLQSRADRVPDNKAILGNLQGELGDFTTGPGTDAIARLKKMANEIGLNVDVSGLAAREQFNKLAGMLAQSQFQALGGTGTDAKLDATTLTSPNSELTKMGNEGIIAMLKGNEDAIAAKNQAWQLWLRSHGPETYGEFATNFNKIYDPRIFQSQYLNADDKKKMLDGMTAAEKNKFRRAYNFAVSQGWIPDPRKPNGAQ